jgi:acyl carrier protein
MGLPALSINWGPWLGVGQAAGLLAASGRDSARGISAISPLQGLAALGRLLERSPIQAGIVPLNARQWREFHIALSAVPVFHEILADGAGAPAHSAVSSRAELPIEDPARLRTALERLVCEQAGKVFRLPPHQIDVRTPLRHFGLDSLMGLEIRNRLEATLGLTFPATLVWSHPTVEGIVEHIAGRLAGAVPQESAQAETGVPRAVDGETPVPDLTLEEAEALLLAEQAKVEALLKELR